MDWLQYACVGLPGAVAIVILTLQLIRYVRKAIEEKNWTRLLTMVMNYMAEAERLFASGADKKTWVMHMVEKSADEINYPINMDKVSALIEELCDMSKKVNPPANEVAVICE